SLFSSATPYLDARLQPELPAGKSNGLSWLRDGVGWEQEENRASSEQFLHAVTKDYGRADLRRSRVLIGVRQAEHGGLVEVAAEDLQPDGQALARVAARH